MKSLEMTDLVQEIGLLIDDWHFTECPHDETGPIYKSCNDCPHFKMCKCLEELSQIKTKMYNSKGCLENDTI